MKQPTFDWGAKEKYAELRSFELEVKIMPQNFHLNQTERVSIIKNCLGRQGLQLLETIMQTEQKGHNEGLFEIVYNTCRPQKNETIKSLQFH